MLRNLSEVLEYINNELFDKIHVLHPYFAVDGRISDSMMRELKEVGLPVILIADRNVFSEIVAAVKKGTFSGKNRKKITSFIIWVSINQLNISPYNGIKESAMAKYDNLSGSKELELFYYLFDHVPFEIIVDSFYREGVAFEGKKFSEVNGEEACDFLSEEPSFLFLYATTLHLVYVLNKYSKPDEQFKEFFTWYFKECLVSEYAIAYAMLFLSQSGIQAPHHYKDVNVEAVISGCSNQARDLQYMQDINPAIYPSDQCILMCVTTEDDMRRVFELVNDRSRYNDVDSYLKVLCSCFPEGKRRKKYEIVKDVLAKHIPINANENNALRIAKNLVQVEESNLRQFLSNK